MNCDVEHRGMREQEQASRRYIKHGLTAKAPVLADEDAAEFEALRQSVFEELQPRGAIQEWLAGRIATQMWRVDRCVRVESLLFSEGRQVVYHDFGKPPGSPAEGFSLEPLSRLHWEGEAPLVEKLNRHEVSQERGLYRAIEAFYSRKQAEAKL